MKMHAPRERKNDIPALVQHFIERKSKETGTLNLATLAPGVIDRLMVYLWPGNVRELENVVEPAMILSRDNLLTFDPFETAVRDRVLRSTEELDMDPLNHVVMRHRKLALEKSEGRVHGSRAGCCHSWNKSKHPEKQNEKTWDQF